MWPEYPPYQHYGTCLIAFMNGNIAFSPIQQSFNSNVAFPKAHCSKKKKNPLWSKHEDGYHARPLLTDTTTRRSRLKKDASWPGNLRESLIQYISQAALSEGLLGT